MQIDNMPSDAMMLLSFLNTRMRDEHVTLDELCNQFGVDRKNIEEKLDKLGYTYNNKLCKFI